ncbi:MAG TPA: hypothetical protein VL128_02075 [Candidatus Eisenbacteria bacterium]|nr:hypothetical protein [Candidatus Eisenbacteria bacterium]
MTVKLRELQEAGARYSDKRRGRRMNSRVRISLEWDATESQRERVEAITRTVNPYGCMVVLPTTLELQQRVALTNMATDASNAAVIVWRGNRQPEGWEYGIELIAPDLDFWGIDL